MNVSTLLAAWQERHGITPTERAAGPIRVMVDTVAVDRGVTGPLSARPKVPVAEVDVWYQTAGGEGLVDLGHRRAVVTSQMVPFDLIDAESDIVVMWDAVNGDEVGALVLCSGCGGSGCETCSGSGTLHRPYAKPATVTPMPHRDVCLVCGGAADVMVLTEIASVAAGPDPGLDRSYACVDHTGAALRYQEGLSFDQEAEVYWRVVPVDELPASGLIPKGVTS